MSDNPPVSWNDFNKVIAALSAQITALERRLTFFEGHTHQNSYNLNNTTRPFTGPPMPNQTNKARG